MITPTQREILEALIQLYEKNKETVKGEEISGVLHRNPGTIRNQMQTLKALGYVEGVPGPKGGYSPSTKAYEALSFEQIKKPYIVSIYRGGKPIEGISVQRIEFNKVAHPTDCTSVITVMGNTRQIKDHDKIKVGPTPVNRLVLIGEVIGRDDNRKELLVALESITSIPKGKVIDVAAKHLMTLTSDMRITDAAKMLAEKKISSAPVIDSGKLVGIITEEEIVRAVSNDRTGGRVGDIMLRDPLTIEKDAKLVDCMQKMKEHGAGRLIVTDNGRPAGMITNTDILLRMLE
jgi:predicted transcriptional regulator